MLKHATVPEMFFNYIIIYKLFSVSYFLGQIATWALWRSGQERSCIVSVHLGARKGMAGAPVISLYANLGDHQRQAMSFQRLLNISRRSSRLETKSKD